MEKTLQKYLVDECEFISSHMSEGHLMDRLFYFSALFGAAQRVINIETSMEVMHLYVVSNWTHTQLNARLQAEQAGAPMTPSMPFDLIEELGQLVGTIGIRIERGQDYTDLLQKMCRIGYSASGNGFYLLERDRL